MSAYNLSLTLASILTITRMFLDIFIMWLLLYYAIKLVRNSSRTVQIFKGILLVVIIDALAKFLGLTTLAYLADMFINWGFLAIIIVFQPEIRNILEKLGKSNVFSRISTLSVNEKEHLVNEVVKATMLLSQDQTGALICIEQSHSLSDYIKTGTPMNSIVTTELLTSIFVTTTPLHDGAVIIQGDKIACASAYFPPTNLDLPSRYGARHRAAIGISEITDSVTIVVSEETGAVSIAEAGKIFVVSKKQLRDYLMRVICGEETEVKPTKPNYPTKPNTPVASPVAKETAPVEPLVNQIPEREERKEDEEKQDTSVLSKLAIKKQAEIEDQKIQPAEIVTAKEDGTIIEEKIVEEPEVVIEPTQPKTNKKAKKKNKRFIFSKHQEDETEIEPTPVNNTDDEMMDELEAESHNIKLPQHYKGPATPSWVTDDRNVRVMGVVTEEENNSTKAASEEVTPAVPHVQTFEEKAPVEQEPVIEQSKPEEVTPVEEKPQEEDTFLKDISKMAPEHTEFDTTKIDFSQFNKDDSDLDEQLAMLDGMPIKKDSTSGNEGGQK